MSEVIPYEVAIRAAVKFSGKNGLKSVTIRSTMAQRCRSRGDLVLESSNDEVFPVELKNVQYPSLVVRSTANFLRINFHLLHQNMEKPIASE